MFARTNHRGRHRAIPCGPPRRPLHIEALEERRLLAVFAVNSTADTVDVDPGDGLAADASGNTTLRAAIMEANATAEADTIELPAGTYELSIGGLSEDAGAEGDLDITRSLVINGAGAADTVIDASPSSDRVFDLHGSATVEFRGLTITGGQANNSGIYGGSEDGGGGIRADFYNRVTIADCVLTRNSAPNATGNLSYGSGGAIDSSARQLTITNCQFTDNYASNSGGAIEASGTVGGVPGTVVIRDTTFADNEAGSGGAIASHHTITIDNSTFVGNGRDPSRFGNGGAINNQGSLVLTNSTVSGNRSMIGGGILSFRSLQIVNSTITGNTAGSGGGVSASDPTVIENTIIAGNIATNSGPDVDGTIISLGHNLIGDTTGSTGFGAVGDLLNVDPQLGPLADNGGPTRTHALLPGSPAIDAANTAAAPETDQRGITRPHGDEADIGAFELGGSTQTYTIVASADGYAEDGGTGDGVFELLDTTGTSVRVRNYLDFGLGERRGVIEFDLSTIPDGATVTSAELRLYVSSYTFPPDPLIHLYGYAGDRAVTVSDVMTDGSQIGTLRIDGTGYVSVPIDAAFIQSQAGTGQYAGILLKKLVAEGAACSFHSLDTLWGSDYYPELVVETAMMPAGEIRGTKFNDLDGDGVRDDGEEGLPDWTIYLDQDANGRLDPGETRTMTGPAGAYEFAGLPPDTYLVAEVSPEGWEQTLPGTQPLAVQWITRDADAVEGSAFPSLSGDGRFVSLLSDAANLVPGDTNGFANVFVYDRQTDSFERASVAEDGSQANGHSSYSSISDDGRYVAFVSAATNLVADDTNGYADVFVFDRQTGTVQRVSIANGGSQANNGCQEVAISADGRYVAFDSAASSLVDGDTNNATDVFVYDRQTETLQRVSVASDGSQGHGYSSGPTISADGRYVAFLSDAPDLISGDSNDATDVFVHDRQTGAVQRVSVGWDGSQSLGHSLWPAISGDGRYVAFTSGADNLVAHDNNQGMDVFVYDRQTATTERVGMAFDGTEADGASVDPAISADGRYVTFSSGASNFVPDDNNLLWDVFVCDRLTGVVRRVNVADDGTETGDQTPFQPALSSDGKYVAFTSPEAGLVPDDNNGLYDVFLTSTEAALLPGTWTLGLTEGRVVENVDFGNRLVPASVAARHVFYNNSRFDGNNPAANGQDDFAIAADKLALLSGETATAANYSNYSRGINGVMVDIAGLADPDSLDADDFQFQVGHINDPQSWQPTAPPTEVDVRLGVGVGGSHRVSLAWEEGAVTNGWLEVTMLPTDNTGLAEPAVFYFANMIGDASGDGATDLSDFNLWNASKFTQVGLDAAADFDRSGAVDLSDFNLWNAHKFTSLATATGPAPPNVVGQEFNDLTETIDELARLRELDRSRPKRSSDATSLATRSVDRLLATYWE